MRLLLDSNVVIHLEDSSASLMEVAASLSRLAHRHGVSLAVHEASRDDFDRDSDAERKFATITKAGKYPPIDQPPEPTSEFLAEFGNISSDNDRVDAVILYAIQKDCADALVTEDQRLHKRAHRLGLAARVYYVEQAVDMLTALFEPTAVALPTVEDVPLHSIDLTDEFFDSLRDGYDGSDGQKSFEDWYREKAREGRKAWVIRSETGIDAICIYNLEDPEGSRSFKLCTFKVGENSRGRHLGELLLKAAFGTCASSGYTNTFAEVKPEQGFLIDFLGEFGFVEDGLKQGSESERVFRKRFLPVPERCDGALDFHIEWAPAFARNDDVGKFFVPVQPQYHGQLFPDAPAIPDDPAQLQAFDAMQVNPSSAVGNGIRKAYISNAPITKLVAGDLVLFYRSHDAHAITTIGVVEATLRADDASAIAAFVGKRTVYTYKEIEGKAAKSVLAILFRQVGHLPYPVRLSEWQSIGGNAYQSITEITDEQFERVMEWGHADPS